MENPKNGSKKHTWTIEDDRTLVLHNDKSAQELADMIGCSLSAVFYNQRRLREARDIEDRLKAQAALEVDRTHRIVPAVAQGELIPTVPPTPVLSEKAKELLADLAADNSRILEDMAVVMDAFAEIRMRSRSIGAQVKMLKDALGLNKKG